jgi:hypothetical protein
MREIRQSGSVRGVRSNPYPYRDFRRDRLSVFLTHGWEARRRLAEKNERSAGRWESGGKARLVTNMLHRLARSRAPNGRRRPVQRTVRSCAGPST